ncbi:TMEM43 family protein [uncultured Enterovirga sp.]|uniref:TMEM43 family protein n=1 Tax=uncultured Enterovirga sp. TaxID=2026352 RepID=UPI0035CC7066
MTWIIRLVATILMGVGFAMVLRPIAVVGDIVPIVGSLLGAGTVLAAFALTAVLAPLVVAIAWLFHRPLVSVGILVAGVAIIYGVRWPSKQRRGAQAVTGRAGLRPAT